MSRASVRQTLVDEVSARLDSGVRVQLGAWDPDDQNLGVYVGQTVGAIEINSMAGGANIVRDDIYTITMVVRSATPGLSASDAETAVADLYQELEDAMVADVTLSSEADVLDWVIGSLNGPDSFPTEEGYVALMEVGVEVHERRGP